MARVATEVPPRVERQINSSDLECSSKTKGVCAVLLRLINHPYEVLDLDALVHACRVLTYLGIVRYAPAHLSYSTQIWGFTASLLFAGRHSIGGRNSLILLRLGEETKLRNFRRYDDNARPNQ